MPSSVSRKTNAAGHEKSQKGIKRLQTVMNVLILVLRNILEFLISRVGRNDKVYQLDTASK